VTVGLSAIGHCRTPEGGSRCLTLCGVAERGRAREIDNDERQRLLRIMRRNCGSVMTWRRAQMILLSAQGMDPAKIAQVTFTSPDRGPGCDPYILYATWDQGPRPPDDHPRPSGGWRIAGAIAATADRVYESLNRQQRELGRRIVLRLGLVVLAQGPGHPMAAPPGGLARWSQPTGSR
jgi:hypothetical protein